MGILNQIMAAQYQEGLEALYASPDDSPLAVAHNQLDALRTRIIALANAEKRAGHMTMWLAIMNAVEPGFTQKEGA